MFRVLAPQLPYRRRSRPAERNRLCLELLEGRCLPSTVTNLSDHDPGSLRDAIATTPNGGTVDFQAGLSGTVVLTTGQLDINKDLTIAGPGANVITVSGNHAARVFDIAATFTVAISGLTIADGMVVQGAYGGGIYNAGTLTLTNCIFSGNTAIAIFLYNPPRALGGAGGIFNAGTLTIASCIFSGNSTNQFGVGGGIVNDGTLSLTDSIFSANSAGLGGGGIYNEGQLSITASAFDFGGGITNLGTLTVATSILRTGISNGQSPQVDAPNSTLTVTECTFPDNGGIGNYATLTVTRCSFSGHTFGCIDIYRGSATISHSTFTSNSYNLFFSSLHGGGCILNYGTLTITDSTFSGNSAEFYGGAIDNAGTLTVTDCTFSGNSSNVVQAPQGTRFEGSTGGGGIYNQGTLTVIGSTFTGNSSYVVDVPGVRLDLGLPGGGGIYNQFGTLAVVESTFSANSADTYGGGINNDGTLTISNSTFSGNSAGTGGAINNLAGVYDGRPHQGTVTMRNTVLAANRAASSGPDVEGKLKSRGHNFIGDGGGGSGYSATDLVGTSARPIDPKLGPLQDNGGPTQTMALLPGSPAIAAGALTDSEWDQRGPGFARTVNGRTDIGAYEVQDAGDVAQPPAFFLARHTDLVQAAAPTAAPGVAQSPSVPLSRAVVAAVDRLFTAGTNVAGWRNAALPTVRFWSFDVFVPERGRD